MNNFNYTISVIENNKIERLNFYSEKTAVKVYKALSFVARYCVNDIQGVQLWKHKKGKTIDNDPHAKIIEKYYK